MLQQKGITNAKRIVLVRGDLDSKLTCVEVHNSITEMSLDKKLHVIFYTAHSLILHAHDIFRVENNLRIMDCL